MMGKEVMMCGTASFLFLLLAFVFTCLKEKAAMLISGFNTLPKEERKKYDTERMSRDQRNLFLICASFLFNIKVYGSYRLCNMAGCFFQGCAFRRGKGVWEI